MVTFPGREGVSNLSSMGISMAAALNDDAGSPGCPKNPLWDRQSSSFGHPKSIRFGRMSIVTLPLSPYTCFINIINTSEQTPQKSKGPKKTAKVSDSRETSWTGRFHAAKVPPVSSSALARPVPTGRSLAARWPH